MGKIKNRLSLAWGIALFTGLMIFCKKKNPDEKQNEMFFSLHKFELIFQMLWKEAEKWMRRLETQVWFFFHLVDQQPKYEVFYCIEMLLVSSTIGQCTENSAFCIMLMIICWYVCIWVAIALLRMCVRCVDWILFYLNF